MDKYCIDSSALIKYPVGVLLFVVALYCILVVFIIWKMCQLCSKAFSYTNFHIHQAYKLYSLALLTILLIIINRLTELEYTKQHEESQLQKYDKFLEGWLILDQIIGIISIFAMNQLHLLAALTWFMVANKVDFSSENSVDHLDVDDPETRFPLHKQIIILRKIFLYLLIPVTLFITIFGILKDEEGWCKTSRIINLLICIIVFLFVAYTFMKLLVKRIKSSTTPLKVKLIWVYMIVMISGRLILNAAGVYQNFAHPISRVHLFNANVWDIIGLLLDVILITILPVLFLSYLAQKQLSKQKEQIAKTSQIFQYKNTFI